MESAAVTSSAYWLLSLENLLPLSSCVPIIGTKPNLVSLNTSITRLNDESFFIISLLVITSIISDAVFAYRGSG